MVIKLRDFPDELANHKKYYSRKSNKRTLSKISILQKVAESRNLCAMEIWSYTVIITLSLHPVYTHFLSIPTFCN